VSLVKRQLNRKIRAHCSSRLRLSVRDDPFLPNGRFFHLCSLYLLRCINFKFFVTASGLTRPTCQLSGRLLTVGLTSTPNSSLTKHTLSSASNDLLPTDVLILRSNDLLRSVILPPPQSGGLFECVLYECFSWHSVYL
jgi:hypothetical protein